MIIPEQGSSTKNSKNEYGEETTYQRQHGAREKIQEQRGIKREQVKSQKEAIGNKLKGAWSTGKIGKKEQGAWIPPPNRGFTMIS